ncbi:pre-rRNA-processing protein esf2-like [Rhagoletis pomonella]|uniref:pre-rRNA-processing protein esf2-like n=1 Tax=Rhagoletis pomonella TaxID=28610 RepID=UPI0017819204|nr:pre-rRNA-processing protein esf2-like [Rhagoletis pomonella]
MVVKMKQKQRRSGLPPPPPPEELEEIPQDDGMQDSPKELSVSSEAVNSEDNMCAGSMQPTIAKNDGTDEDDDEMDLGNFSVKPKKKRKKGIIYVSNIPKHMNVTRIREILGEYGKIGRVYLQPEKLPGNNDKKKKRKRIARHFTEGWVEFESKRVAKQIVELLNNKQISTRKKSQFYDYLWSMKYLPRFKWVHLTERMNYEQAVHKQRLSTEVSQARKETTFFQNNLDKSEFLKKKSKKATKGKESQVTDE